MIDNLASLRARISADSPDLFNPFEADDPRRLKPLSLEQQKKRAKELLRDWKASAGEEHADKRLSDAQFAIARSHGCKNWPQLKLHIERNRIARDALVNSEPEAPDGQRRALHIRCGTDIRHALAMAGFRGDFLAFFDPLAHGPLPDSDDLETYLRIRADYISQKRQADAEKVFEDLGRQYAALEQARSYDAVHLWFEHDPFDQLILAIALERHLQQLPSQRNGLNLSENLTLEILHDKGGMNAARLFGWYTNHYEPLVFMGDSFYWRLLADLADGKHPAIVIDREGEEPRRWQVGLTETGRRLLRGETDWIAQNGFDRWIGGIHLESHRGELWRTASAITRRKSIRQQTGSRDSGLRKPE